ncbi:MAG: SDR family oxidoreductase [Burkholderiales bacterium]|nr:SDR family oxidoreductase [Burkholderiales bacterium]
MTQRVAVVTGAAGTIGQGVIENLLEHGRKVVLVDRDEPRLRAARDRFAGQGEMMSVAVDLLEETAPALVAASIEENGWQPATIVINNAAITVKHGGKSHDILQMTLDEWALVHRINVTAPMLMARQFLPAMVAGRWGRIVNISSRAGRYNPHQAGPSYTTTKAAVLGLTRSIANDFSKHGVTCNSVAPGLVMSDMTGQLTPQLLQALVDRTPAGRGGSPRELGAAIAFLASEDAGFITGTCLDVNGGQSMA